MIDLLAEYSHLLWPALAKTLSITGLAFGLGLAIALLLTVTRFFAPQPLPLASQAYIDFFRGTPLLVQILLIYFGLPSLGVKLDAFTAATLAIGLNSGAYQAEILRTAIKGIPEDQVLVAESMGLSRIQVYRHVVIPQALRNALPGLTNEVVMLLKESALASVIGVVELTRLGEYMTAATFRAFEAYLLVALIYLALSYALFRSLRRAERRFAIPGFERWA